MNTNNEVQIVYPRLSYELMGVLFGVHNQLGSALLEKHYQRAIEQELIEREIGFEKEKCIRLIYKEKDIGKYFLDFVIDTKIVLEVKATRDYGQKSARQAFSYLKQLDLPLAIVANFHGKKLRYKRIINPKYKGVQLQD